MTKTEANLIEANAHLAAAQSKHTPTPEVYPAHCDIVRDQGRIKDYTPAIRFQDGGQELAVITLSGYKVGHEMSPMDWAKRFAMCSNTHDDLVSHVENYRKQLMDRGDAIYALEKYNDDLIAMVNEFIIHTSDFDRPTIKDSRAKAIVLVDNLAKAQLIDEPHEENCPAIDGFGCRCGEAQVTA